MEEKSVFNIIGVPSEEFIEEVTDPQLIKKNGIFMAVLADGLAGDPEFGVGMSELLGEQNVSWLRTELNRKASTIPDIVENVDFKGMAVDQKIDEQFIGADLHFVDKDSNDDILIPLGFANQ